MNYFLPTTCLIFMSLLFAACSGNSNKAALEQATPHVPKYILTATEFIELSECDNLPCIQLSMKDISSDFFHAYPGEFGNINRLIVIDTLGDSLDIPVSTLYVSVDPGADWRIAHTLHNKEFSDYLLQEFADQQFLLSDSVYSRKNKGYKYHYRSDQYPGLVLSHFKTFEPWRARGLYYTVTWPCYVFELHKVQ